MADQTRSALTFEEFVDVAIGAAIKAAARHGGGSTPNPDDPGGGKGPKKPPGGPGPVILPFPIWVGIVAGPFNQGGNLGNAGNIGAIGKPGGGL
jgi:hypothetical protein